MKDQPLASLGVTTTLQLAATTTSATAEPINISLRMCFPVSQRPPQRAIELHRVAQAEQGHARTRGSCVRLLRPESSSSRSAQLHELKGRARLRIARRAVSTDRL